jgi:hypothetical protein
MAASEFHEKGEQPMSWVVYRKTLKKGKPSGMGAVCEQSEWDAMDRAQPGYHKLVLSGIANEGEAERVARECLVDNALLAAP